MRDESTVPGKNDLKIGIIEFSGSFMVTGHFEALNDIFATQEMKQRLSCFRAWTGKG